MHEFRRSLYGQKKLMDASGSAITGRTKFAEPRQLFEDFVRRRVVVASCSRFRLFALNKLEKKPMMMHGEGEKNGEAVQSFTDLERFARICLDRERRWKAQVQKFSASIAVHTRTNS